MLDYEIQRCTRRCAATGKELTAGEEFYTIVRMEGDEILRQDFSSEAWKGPPEGVLGCWRARMPDAQASSKPTLAPPEVILRIFEELHQQGTALDFVYVLALLMIRRRIVRLEETTCAEKGKAFLMIHAQGSDQTVRVEVCEPKGERVPEIQDRISQLLFSGGDVIPPQEA